ncbi:glycoside hydrolase family 5 protein [Xylaria nigripes]|nr:glycoside hydrolase family 5 protein [Xylaria nigripes]
MFGRCYSIFTSLALLPVIFAHVQFLGVTVLGGDFTCPVHEKCPAESPQLPLTDRPARINHVIKQSGINLLRIPTSWHFLLNNQPGGNLDTSNFSRYDESVQSCLGAGAYCIVNTHDSAPWGVKTSGQDRLTDEQFSDLWGQLARRYATHEKIIFGLMNEPQDDDVSSWVRRSQGAVTAIRNAGATSQMILLPGSNFHSTAKLVSTGNFDRLLAVTNPDGDADNLLLDILADGKSGTHPCTANNFEAMTLVAKYLRKMGRRSFISENRSFGNASCVAAMCAQNTFIDENSDVFAALVSGAAGSLDTTSTLNSTNLKYNDQLVNLALLRRCLPVPWRQSHGNNRTTRILDAVVTNPPTPTSSTLLKPIIGPSTDLIILTDFLLQSTDSTLETATGTPPLPSSLGGQSTTPSIVIPPSETPVNGGGSLVVETRTLWICAVVAAMSLLKA